MPTFFGVFNGPGGGGAATAGLPATSTPVRANDNVGAIGALTSYARGDHKHPAQAPSSDAGNLLSQGSDGLDKITLSASEQGVPTVGTYVLGWVNGVLTAIPA